MVRTNPEHETHMSAETLMSAGSTVISLEPWLPDTLRVLSGRLEALREAAATLEREHQVCASLRTAVMEHAQAAVGAEPVLEDVVRTMHSASADTAARCLVHTLATNGALASLIEVAIQCLRTLPESFFSSLPDREERARIDELHMHGAALIDTASRHFDMLAKATTLIDNEIEALQRALVVLMRRRG